MKNDKGFVGMGLVLAIIAILVVGGGAYYLGTKNNSIPQNPVTDNSQPINKDTIFNSVTYGYSISYTGISSKYVYIESDGKSINLFPDQSNIDNLKIVDSSYVMEKDMSSLGTVIFGTNQYQKFKDNITPRHTYYLKSGLKNNKSILISVENDSDIPNYFNLASFKILDTTTQVNVEESSTEVFNNQPGAIKSIKANGNNNWTLAVDLLSGNPKWLPGDDNSGGYFINQNPKIRNLNVTVNTKTYNCGAGPDGNGTSADVLENTSNFIIQIQKNMDRAKLENRNGIGEQRDETNWNFWQTAYFDINGTNIIAIYEQCLP